MKSNESFFDDPNWERKDKHFSNVTLSFRVKRNDLFPKEERMRKNEEERTRNKERRRKERWNYNTKVLEHKRV